MVEPAAHVTPEPPPDEREALLAALRVPAEAERPALEPWAAAGLREAVEQDARGG